MEYDTAALKCCHVWHTKELYPDAQPDYKQTQTKREKNPEIATFSHKNEVTTSSLLEDTVTTVVHVYNEVVFN